MKSLNRSADPSVHRIKFTFDSISSALTVVTLSFTLAGCVSTFGGKEATTSAAQGAPTEAAQAPRANESDSAESTQSTNGDDTVAGGPGGFMPACLNVVENDLRVEFDKSRLILQDGKKPRSLSLHDGEQVRCEKLRILEKTKRPSVEIVYLTRETGTSINMIERRMAIASIRDGKWVAKPLVVDRLYSEGDEVKTVPVMEVKWSEDKGCLVLTRTDIASKESETIRP